MNIFLNTEVSDWSYQPPSFFISLTLPGWSLISRHLLAQVIILGVDKHFADFLEYEQYFFLYRIQLCQLWEELHIYKAASVFNSPSLISSVPLHHLTIIAQILLYLFQCFFLLCLHMEILFNFFLKRTILYFPWWPGEWRGILQLHLNSLIWPSF